jgi:D-glycero-D-manno-heptose 1,7-bisphosphate phosphatase
LNPLKTVFLDRDGVINQDSPTYIKSWAEFHFIPGSLDAIARLTRNGCSVIVITNQSAINRGMIPMPDLENIHRRMHQAVLDVVAGSRTSSFAPTGPMSVVTAANPNRA